jgi:hypothetical protein
MANKKEKIMQKIVSDLGVYESFEDKHKYLQEHKYLDRVYEKYPDLKEQINELMIGNVIGEFGDELSDQFKFSKTMSNKEVLRNLNLSDANVRYLKDFEFETESPKLISQLQSLNLIDPSDIEYSDKERKVASKGIVRGTDAFDALIELKNQEFQELQPEKAGLRKNIKTLRREFDDRVGHFSTLKPTMVIPGLNTLTKYSTQLLAGWTDIFRKEGMEKVENRRLTWDPEEDRFGPGPEIGLEQDKLEVVFDLEDKLKDKWAGVDTKYEELDEMIDKSIAREEKLQATGVDEALNYIDMQGLRSLLGE